MKSSQLLVLLALSLATCLTSFKNKDDDKLDVKESKEIQANEVFMVDVKKSKLEWFAKGATKQHNGTVDFKSGNMQIDTKQIKTGFFYFDMKSIKNSDIKDEGFNKQLVDHLKGEDFFHATKFTQGTFKITKATRLDVPEGQLNYTIVGDLTIKGITKSIEFPALVAFSKKSVTTKAEVTIDRTNWNITYNSGNFFKDLGDKLIEDKITLKFNVVAEVK